MWLPLVATSLLALASPTPGADPCPEAGPDASIAALAQATQRPLIAQAGETDPPDTEDEDFGDAPPPPDGEGAEDPSAIAAPPPPPPFEPEAASPPPPAPKAAPAPAAEPAPAEGMGTLPTAAIQIAAGCGISVVAAPLRTMIPFVGPFVVSGLNGAAMGWMGDTLGDSRAGLIWPVIAAIGGGLIGQAILIPAIIAGVYGGVGSIGLAATALPLLLSGRTNELAAIFATSAGLLGGVALVGGCCGVGSFFCEPLAATLAYHLTSQKKRPGDDGSGLPGLITPGHPKPKSEIEADPEPPPSPSRQEVSLEPAAVAMAF
jgi:hypothetical protein